MSKEDQSTDDGLSDEEGGKLLFATHALYEIAETYTAFVNYVDHNLQVLDARDRSPWEDLSSDRLGSLFRCVRTIHELLLAGNGLDCAYAHDLWRGTRETAGWSWGETFDEEEKIDPHLVPFDQLIVAVQSSRTITHHVVYGVLSRFFDYPKQKTVVENDNEQGASIVH